MGSGALPNLSIPSVGIAFKHCDKKKNRLFPIKFAEKLRNYVEM